MQVMTRNCGCIYLVDENEMQGILVFYCGYERDGSPWGFGDIKELPEGQYETASMTGTVNVLKQIRSRMIDGEKFREIKYILGVKGDSDE